MNIKKVIGVILIMVLFGCGVYRQLQKYFIKTLKSLFIPFCGFYNSLNLWLRGVRMAKFWKLKNDKYRVRIQSSEGDILRILPIVPYFWDTFIYFDILIELKNNKIAEKCKTVNYEWELYDLDEQIIKKGNGIYNTKYLRQNKAIKLGFLKPPQHYVLYIKIKDDFQEWEFNPIVSLTIKDRDEYLMQIGLILFTIIATLFFSVMAKGVGI
jgi:hypothetical protein